MRPRTGNLCDRVQEVCFEVKMNAKATAHILMDSASAEDLDLSKYAKGLAATKGNDERRVLKPYVDWRMPDGKSKVYFVCYRLTAKWTDPYKKKKKPMTLDVVKFDPCTAESSAELVQEKAKHLSDGGWNVTLL